MKNNDLTPAEWEKIIINRAFGNEHGRKREGYGADV